jgi:hypothetical protein
MYQNLPDSGKGHFFLNFNFPQVTPKISINRDKIPRVELEDELVNSIEINTQVNNNNSAGFRGKKQIRRKIFTSRNKRNKLDLEGADTKSAYFKPAIPTRSLSIESLYRERLTKVESSVG